MPFSIVLSRIWGRKRAPATRANSHPQWPHMASTVKPASATISKMQPRLHTSTTIILLVEFSVSTWAGFRPLPSQVYHIHLYIYIYIYIYIHTHVQVLMLHEGLLVAMPLLRRPCCRSCEYVAWLDSDAYIASSEPLEMASPVKKLVTCPRGTQESSLSRPVPHFLIA